MSLEYAILGFLNYRPLSGYDLKKVFDNSVRHFWPADQSQIYRTLAKLAERGHVEQEIVRGLDHPDRNEYRIPPAGHEALRSWLNNPLPSQDVRIAALIQVFFAGQLSDQETLALFERFAAGARAGLETYVQIRKPADADVEATGMQRESYFWGLTLEYGILSARMELEWFESVITRVKSGQLPPTPTEP